MAEYLSPGVYVEEFDSGAKPMEGVGTSTAGLIGVAERGPVEGLPQLVTNFADFKRMYGGYLSANEYGDYRYLAYAVEHFFINGGARAFIARVAPGDAACAEGVLPMGGPPVLTLSARNPGMWGNNLKVVISPSSKAKTQIYEELDTALGKAYSVKNGAGFYAGDIAAFSDGVQTVYNRVVKCQDNIMTFESDFGRDVTDRQLLPQKTISTCEFNMEVRFEDIVESYDHISFNIETANFVEKKLAKSDLITVRFSAATCSGAETGYTGNAGGAVAGSEGSADGAAAGSTGNADGAVAGKLGSADGAAAGNAGSTDGAAAGNAGSADGAAAGNTGSTDGAAAGNAGSTDGAAAGNAGSTDGAAAGNTAGGSSAKGAVSGSAHIPPFNRLASGNAAVVLADFTGGSNGNALAMTAAEFIGVDNGAGKRTGIQAFVDNDVVSIIAVPGVTDPNVQLSLVAHCENLASRFAVLDIPREARKVQDIINHRNIFDTTYAALYHPWVTVFDPLDKRNISIPPSGSIIGIYARSDNTRGVHKAPANEVVRACVGLDVQFNKGEQDILNPKGVNLIRAFPGQGIRVWGARTASSDGSWKYINVRRLFIFIEESIKANTNWAVFEPNDEVLWVRVQRTIEVFLTNLWRGGSLAGTSPDEAFFVNIGRSTMSQDDIDNGRLICVIGVAPVKPAEFVIFRITQKTGDAQ